MKFKIGDRVRYIGDNMGFGIRKNDVGFVFETVHVCGDINVISVKFDNNDGHRPLMDEEYFEFENESELLRLRDEKWAKHKEDDIFREEIWEHMKKFKEFKLMESIEKENILSKYFMKQELNSMEKVNNGIKKHTKTTRMRFFGHVMKKVNDPVIDCILGSMISIFYADYNKEMGDKIQEIPVPDDIYDYEDVIKKIDELLNETDGRNILLNGVLNRIKNMIVYMSYFKNIRDDVNKRFGTDKELFDIFLGNDEEIDEYDDPFGEETIDIHKNLWKRISSNRSAINATLFCMDSYEEIGTIERTFLKLYPYVLEYENVIKKRYLKYFNDKMKDSDFFHNGRSRFDIQLDMFNSFSPRILYTAQQLLRDDSIDVNETKNAFILGKITSLFDKKEEKDLSFEFTGDWIEDYRRYDDAYKKSRQ